MKTVIVPRLLPWAGLMLLASLACAGAQAAGDHGSTSPAAGSLLAAPPDARKVDGEQSDFETYPLIVDRVAQRGGIDGNIAATRTVEGPLRRVTYRVPPGHAADEVAAGYRQRLANAGFKLLFHCDGSACGPTFLRASPGYRADADLFDVPLANQRYLAARRRAAAGDTYAAVQIAGADEGLAIQVDTLRVKPREVAAISVSAAEMSRELNTKGRIALYGIFFKTDSAEIEPGSKTTLDEIGKLMKQRPKLKLLVVGHTDNRGSFDYNIELSKRRAQAVVASLVDDYGVARERLKPWGVGYTVPRASNNSDVGQAKNRRVELVVW